MKLTICCHSLLFSEGLKKILEGEPSIGEIAVAGNQEIEKITDPANDLVIADLDIFFDHAEEFLEEGRPKVLVIYNTSRLPLLSGQLSEFVSRGLVGVLPPETNTGLLTRAIKAVFAGELWINHKSFRDLIVNGHQKSILTKQEEQIVAYICHGCKNKEIAQKMDITEQTVKGHCNRIYKKFGVSDRLQLALLFISDKALVKSAGK